MPPTAVWSVQVENAVHNTSTTGSRPRFQCLSCHWQSDTPPAVSYRSPAFWSLRAPLPKTAGAPKPLHQQMCGQPGGGGDHADHNTSTGAPCLNFGPCNGTGSLTPPGVSYRGPVLITEGPPFNKPAAVDRNLSININGTGLQASDYTAFRSRWFVQFTDLSLFLYGEINSSRGSMRRVALKTGHDWCLPSLRRTTSTLCFLASLLELAK